jgi:iron complex outermembrane receptor protein
MAQQHPFCTRSSFIWALALAAGSSLPAARAAEPPRADAVNSGVLAEIIVTAQKREQNLQEVPLSVAAFSGETLAETGVQDFSSLAARIPGVALNSAGPGRSSYSIRGIASIGGNAPTTGVYVDEAPILPSGGDGANASIDPDLFDLARVEVLRGPQGTLYGSSSMGGTVRLITNQPNLTVTEGAVRTEGSGTQHGSGNFRFDGMFNAPLIDDRVALRIVGTYKDFSGFINREIGVWAPNANANPAFPPYPVPAAVPSAIIKGVNTEQRYSLRTALRIAVNDRLTITPSVWVQHLNVGAPPDFDVPAGQSGGPLVQRRPFNISEAYTDHFVISNLTVTYALDFGSITSATSFMHRVVYTPDDETEALEINIPQGQFVPNSYAPTVTTREFTEELRLGINPAGSPLSGVVGAYYNDSNRHYDVFYGVSNYDALFRNSPTSIAFFGPGPLDNNLYSQSGDYAPKQSALFAEFNYDVLAKLTATAGVRWYQLQYDTVRNEDGLTNGGPSISAGTAKNSGFNPKVSLSYQLDPDVLVYTTAARGVRPGGTNTSNLKAKGCGQDYGPYQPDSLWNYELGGKSRWFGGALVANGAVYYIKWNDVQQGQTLPCSYQITQNAGKAVVHGAELELEAQSGPLLLTLGVGYTKATLAEDSPSLGGVKGEQLQNVPLWNASASVKYSFQPAPSLKAFVRADAQYVDQSYPDFTRTDPATFQRAYSLIDLRTGVVSGPWQTNVFLNNVLDKQASLSRFISDNYDASSRSRMFTNRPRTLGISVQRSF